MFTDLALSLQSTYNSKYSNHEFLVSFLNVIFIYSYNEGSFYMPRKTLNLMLVWGTLTCKIISVQWKQHYKFALLQGDQRVNIFVPQITISKFIGIVGTWDWILRRKRTLQSNVMKRLNKNDKNGGNILRTTMWIFL